MSTMSRLKAIKMMLIKTLLPDCIKMHQITYKIPKVFQGDTPIPHRLGALPTDPHPGLEKWQGGNPSASRRGTWRDLSVEVVFLRGRVTGWGEPWQRTDVVVDVSLRVRQWVDERQQTRSGVLTTHIYRVKWRHRIYGHNTIAMLWV